jgi:hypothetical protein
MDEQRRLKRARQEAGARAVDNGGERLHYYGRLAGQKEAL